MHTTEDQLFFHIKSEQFWKQNTITAADIAQILDIFSVLFLLMNFVHCVRVRSTPYKGDKILKGVFFFVPSSQNDRNFFPYLP